MPRFGLCLVLLLVVLCACADASNDESAATTAASTIPAPAYVHPGSDELSARQVEMLEVVDGYISAWQARDGDLAATYMTDEAVFEYHEFGTSFSVADGSLQSRIRSGPYDSLRRFEPELVFDEHVVLTGIVETGSVRFLSVITFTKSGDVAIAGETIFLGPDR